MIGNNYLDRLNFAAKFDKHVPDETLKQIPEATDTIAAAVKSITAKEEFPNLRVLKNNVQQLNAAYLHSESVKKNGTLYKVLGLIGSALLVAAIVGGILGGLMLGGAPGILLAAGIPGLLFLGTLLKAIAKSKNFGYGEFGVALYSSIILPLFLAIYPFYRTGSAARALDKAEKAVVEQLDQIKDKFNEVSWSTWHAQIRQEIVNTNFKKVQLQSGSPDKSVVPNIAGMKKDRIEECEARLVFLNQALKELDAVYDFFYKEIHKA